MNVLFIGNNASRTGAPIGLLHLLRWLKKETDIEFEMLLRVGAGPLAEAYAQLCEVTAYGDLWSDLSVGQRLRRRLRPDSSRRTPAETLYADRGFDLVYANTATHGGILGDLAGLRCPVLCHVHELETVLRKYGARNLRKVKRHAGHFLAASQAVRDNLVGKHGIPAPRVDVVHECIPVDEHAASDRARAVRETFGIPNGAMVVGGCGNEYERKGMDLFVDVAAACSRGDPSRPLHFLWMGAAEASRTRFDEAVRRAGVESSVHVMGETNTPQDVFGAMDVLAMVSREDPFPYVNLEAGIQGKPAICFDGTGGSAEFVGDDAGCVVPFLDVAAFARRILGLSADEGLRARLGRRAAEKVRTLYNVDTVAPRIVEILESVIAGYRDNTAA